MFNYHTDGVNNMDGVEWERFNQYIRRLCIRVLLSSNHSEFKARYFVSSSSIPGKESGRFRRVVVDYLVIFGD